MAKWRKLAKSIKLKIYMYLSNKEDVSAKIKALIEEGDLLSSSADDCKFPFYDSPATGTPTPNSTTRIRGISAGCISARRRSSIR